MPAPVSRNDMLGRATFVAFDTETTGLWAISNRLVEIAAVKFRVDSDTYEEFQTLIDPGRAIPLEATAVHGITDQMVSGAPTAEHALEKFLSFCGTESILIAHNATFDISFVGNEMDRAKLAFPPNLIIDTVDMFKRYVPGLASYSLISLSRHYNLAENQEHRGLSDAQLVRRLFCEAMGLLPPVESAERLAEHLAVYELSDWRPEQVELPAHYADLTAAVEHGYSVEIVYRGSGANESSRVIRPFQIHNLGSVYYIVAYCEQSQAERTFRLDRIISHRVIRL